MNKNQVLKQRSVTGLFFIFGVISLLLTGKMGAMTLAVFIAGFSTYEYIRMIFPKNKKKLISTVVLVGFVIVNLTNPNPESSTFLFLSIISSFLLVCGIINLFTPFINHKKFYWLVAILYFGFPLGLFISYIHQTDHYNPIFWLSVISMIWMADSFAYLIGSTFGKRKLLEKISPKKTWEGFLGAGLTTVLIAYVYGKYFYNEVSHTAITYPYFWVIIALIAWIIGTLGDLVESSVKRNFNIKDSGKLFPGHGGVLDRFDSFIYILPFVLLLLLII
ncbi:MAG: phosphatidate cytidylyltransferase [Saprospiraceae bacterium]|jgi:phosphatidate cytidylyltransferase|nr:phosphatidate cytidylyltransferase [Saprospiraceae bacterium]